MRFFLCLSAFAAALMIGSAAFGAPQGGRITQGQGRIEQIGSHTDIHQNSDFLATQWQNFNIGANESAQAHQPSASSRLLIRIDGAGPTNIAGSYTSNGITIIENQNGVQFSRGAVVNVGGLLATSARISGVTGSKWTLDGIGGVVVNHGTITAGTGGAVLAAVRVENTGTITSNGGDVALGVGEAFTVDFAGGLVGFEVKKGAAGAALVNEGRVEAQGGIVKLTAQEAQAVRANVVSVGGVVKATKLERRGGVVYLSGGGEGVNEVSGAVEADEKVEATGKYVVVKSAAQVKAPEILVGGDYQGKGPVPTSLRTFVEPNVLLDAGRKGRVIVWADEITWFHGAIFAPGGFAEVSGKESLAAVNLGGIDVGTDGTLLLDPENVTFVSGSGNSLTAGNTEIGVADDDFFREGAGSGTDLMINVDTLSEVRGDIIVEARGTITSGVLITYRHVGSGDLTLDADILDLNNVFRLGSTLTLSAREFRGSLLVNARSAIIIYKTPIRPVVSYNFTDVNDEATITPEYIPVPLGGCGDSGACVITVADGTAIPGNIRSAPGENLRINAGSLDVTFEGSGEITLEGAAVRINAGSLNTAGRAITITTVAGTLTLNTDIDTSLTADGSTTYGDINLTGTGGTPSIRFMGGKTVGGRMVRTLLGDSITIRGDATASNDLSITAALALRLRSRLEVDEGGDLFLKANGSVAFLIDDDISGDNITLISTGSGSIKVPDRGFSNAVTIIARGTLTLEGKNLLVGNLDASGALALSMGDISVISDTFTFGDASGNLGLTITGPPGEGPVADFVFDASRIRGIDLGSSNNPTDVLFNFSPRALAATNSIMIKLPDRGLMRFIPTITMPSITAPTIDIAAASISSTEGATVRPMTITAATSLTLDVGSIDVRAGSRLTRTYNDLSIVSPAITLKRSVTFEAANIDIDVIGLADGVSSVNLTIRANNNGVLDFGGNVNIGSGGKLDVIAGNITASAASELTIDVSRSSFTLQDFTIIPLATTLTEVFSSANAGAQISITGVDEADLDTTLSFTQAVVPNNCDGNADSNGHCVIDLTTASGDDLILAFNSEAAAGKNLTIIAAGKDLTFGLGNRITITGAEVSITANALRTGGRPLTITASSGTLTLAASVDTSGADLVLSASGALTFTPMQRLFADNITLETGEQFIGGSVHPVGLNYDTGLTFHYTGSGTHFAMRPWMISHTSKNDIRGRRVTFISDVSLSIQSAIDTRSAPLGSDLTRVGGGTLILRASGVIIFASNSATVLQSGAITIEADTDQTPTATGQDLTINANESLSLSANLNTFDSASPTTGNLIFGAGRITLGSDVTIITNAITLGAVRVENNNDLTITARGDLTLGGDIDLDGGTLTLRLGGSFGVAAAQTITAALLDVRFLASAAGFTQGSVDNLMVDIGGEGARAATEQDFGILGGGVACPTTNNACALSLSEGDILSGTLTASSGQALTISAAGLTVEFGGIGAITITGTAVSITAASLNTVGRPLTITASGGVLTLNTDINTSDSMRVMVGDLTLSGSSIALDRDLTTISAHDISLTGGITASDKSLAITATGTLTLASAAGIDLGAGDLTLRVHYDLAVSTASTLLTVATLSARRTASNTGFTGMGNLRVDIGVASARAATADDFPALTGQGCPRTGACSLALSEGSFATDVIAVPGQSVTIDIGGSTLSADSFAGSGQITIMGTAITFTGGGVVFFDSSSVRPLVLRATQGDLTIPFGNFQLRRATLESPASIVFSSNGIFLGGPGSAVESEWTVNGNVDFSGTGNIGLLDVNLTLNGNLISSSASLVSLGASGGTITLQGAGKTREIKCTASNCELNVPSSISGTDVNLTISSAGTLRINGSINLTRGDLHWTHNSSQAAVFGGELSAIFTISARNITFANPIVVGIPGSDAVLTATGTLTFGGDFNTTFDGNALGSLTLTAGAIRASAATILTIRAADSTITLTNPVSAALTLTEAFSAASAGNAITIAGVSDLETFTGTYTPPPIVRLCATAACVFNTADGDGNLSDISRTLSADTSIEINVPGGILSFAEGAGDIMITAPIVSITAGSIDTGGSNLVITASGGTLTLSVDISDHTGSLTLSGSAITLGRALILTGTDIMFTGDISATNRALTIDAASDLTLGGDIDLGAGDLTLRVGGGFAIAAQQTLTVNSLDALFTTSAADFTAGSLANLMVDIGSESARAAANEDFRRVRGCSSTGACTITLSAGDMLVASLMAASGQALTISADGLALEFAGTGAITLSGTTISITAASINVGSRALTITASTGNLTLNTGINTLNEAGTSGGAIALIASGNTIDFSSGGSAYTITGGTITLTASAITADQGFTIDAKGGNIVLAATVNVGMNTLTLEANDMTCGAMSDQACAIQRDSAVGVLDLTASTIRLEQAAAFSTTQIFDPTDPNASDGIRVNLELVTLSAQSFSDWMDSTGWNLDLVVGGVLTIPLETPEMTADVGNFFVDLSLTAATIVSAGSLTLRAIDTMEINADITLSAPDSDLNIRAGAGGIISDSAHVLSAFSIIFRQSRSFTAADAAVNPFRFTFGGSVDSLTITLIGSARVQQYQSWMGTLGRDLTIIIPSDAATRFNIDTDIDLGSGDLVLFTSRNAGEIVFQSGVSEITAGSFTARADTIRISDPTTPGATRMLAINTVAGILIDTENVSNITEIIGARATLTLDSDSDDDGTGDLTLMISSMRLNRLTLDGAAIGLTGVIAAADITSGLDVDASGVLTLNSNIDTGAGDLVLSGSSIDLGAAVELGGGAITLTGAISDSVGLTVVATGILTLNSNIATGAGDLVLSGSSIVPPSSLVALSGAAITLTGLITSSNALTVAATGVLTLNSDIMLTSPAGAQGNLTLSGGSIALGSALTLTGTAIMLTGDVSATDTALTIKARGTLTLGGNINLGSDPTNAVLTMTLGGIIASAQRTLTAGEINITFSVEEALLTDDDRGNLSFVIAGSSVGGPSGGYMFPATHSCAGANLSGGNCTITISDGSAFLLAETLAPSGSLTISAVGRDVEFDGTGAIELSGTSILITAASLNAGSRALTITASTGALTLDVSRVDAGVLMLSGMTELNLRARTGADTLTLVGSDVTLSASSASGITTGTLSGTTFTAAAGNLTISATGGLTVVGSVNVGVGNVLLTADSDDDDSGDLTLTSSDTITAAEVVLSQRAAFGSDSPLVFASGLTSLTLTNSGATAQPLYGWMFAASGARALVVNNEGGAITIAHGSGVAALDNGAGDITLNAGTLALNGAGTDNVISTLLGGVIVLTGSLDESVATDLASGVKSLTIRAQGALTINDNIMLAADQRLILEAGAGAGDSDLVIAGTVTLSSRNIELYQDGAFASTITARVEGARSSSNATLLRLIAGAAQTFHPAWQSFVRNNFSITAPSLTITATTASATFPYNLTLHADAIGITVPVSAADNTLTITNEGSLTFGGVLSLSEADVVRAGVVTVGGGSLAVLATGVITAHGDITVEEFAADDGSGSTITRRGDLTLTAGTSGSGNLVGSATPTLLARRVNFSQFDLFAADPLFVFAPGVEAVGLTITTTSGTADQTIHAWMIAPDRGLSVVNNGGSVIVVSDIDLGSGALTLQAVSAGSILLSDADPSSPAEGYIFNGSEINLMSAISITLAKDLMVTARGDLTIGSVILALSSEIGVGVGALVLEAGAGDDQTGVIAFGSGNTITAVSVSLTQDGAVFVGPSAPATFMLPTDVLPLVFYRGEADQTDHAWFELVDLIAEEIALIPGGSFVAPSELRASERIELNAGSGVLSFAGDGEIVIEAPEISIIAGSVSIGSRALTIMADGELTLGGTVSVISAGVLSISAQSVSFNRSLRLTATVGALSLSGDFIAAPASRYSLTLSATAAATTTPVVFAGGSINFTGATSIDANNVSLLAVGQPTAPSEAIMVTIRARRALVINADINVGRAGGVLSLRTVNFESNRNTNFGSGRTLTALSLEFMSDQPFVRSPALTLTVGSLSLLYGGRSRQDLLAWMVVLGRGLSLEVGGQLNVAASALDFGTGALELVAGQNTNRRTRNRNITFATGASTAITASSITLTNTAVATVNLGTRGLTLTASGAINLNTNLSAATLALTAGMGATTGAIEFDASRAVVLTSGGALTLTSDTAPASRAQSLTLMSGILFGSSSPFVGHASTSASDLEFITTASGAQAVQAWMPVLAMSSGSDFVLRAAGDVTLSGARDFGSGAVTLEAGNGNDTGVVNFDATVSTASSLIGGAITLTGDAAPTVSNNALTVTASGDLNINTDINVGTGDLTLTAGSGTNNEGSINFNSSRPTTLTAAALTLVANAAPEPSDADLTLSVATLNLGALIDVGRGALTLGGVVPTYTGSAGLVAGSLEALTLGALDTSANNYDLTFAADSLTITGNIDVGAGSLSLTARRGAIMFTASTPGATLTLSGGMITLRQQASFGSGALGAVLSARAGVSFISTGTSNQTLHATLLAPVSSDSSSFIVRVVSVNRSVVVSAESVAVGSRSLVLEGNNIVFGSAATEILAADITLTTGSRGGISTNRRAVTLTATGNILLNTSIGLDSRGRLDTRAGNLTLAAVGGIDFDAQRSITLNGGVVRLTAGAVDLASDNMGTALIRARGGLTLTGSFGTGEGNLSLIAGGALNFGGGTASDTTVRNGAVVLSGSVITLTGGANPTASNQALTVTATGNLTINTNIDTGAAGDLTLASGGALQFRTNRATQLSGDNIMLTSSSLPRAGRQSLTVSAQRDLVVNASLHTGASTSRSRAGVLTLRAGVASSVGVGGLSFATSAPVELTGRNIIFESDGDASVSMAGSHNLTIRAFTNLEISSDLRLGSMSGDEMSSVLSLRARTIEVAGDRVMAADQIIVRQDGSLFTDQQPASFVSGELRVIATGNQRYYAWMGSVMDRSLWLESTGGNIILDAAIDLGAGSLTLRAASRRRLIILETAADRFVGADITLVSSGTITTGGRDLTIAATGDLRIDASVNAGTGQVALSGATLVFGGATRVVNGGEIMLTGRGAPASASNRSLTVRARNDLTVLGHLNAGTGSLTLIGGLNTRVGRTTQVNAGSLYLGVSSAGDSVETVLNGLNIVLIGDAGGTSRASTESVSVVARRGLSVSTDILTSGDLVLSAGAGLGSRDMGVLQLRRDAATRLTGAMIELSADPRRGALPAASNRDLTIEASRDLTLAAHLNAGTGDVVLTAGGTILLSTARDVEVRGDDVQLQGGAASPASGRRLRVIALGDIEVGVDLDTGTGDLVLTAGTGTTRVGRRRVGNIGVINFAGARLLTGDVITLTGDTVRDEAGAVEMPSASDALLRVVALRGLRVNTHMNAGSGNLMLEAGAGTGTRETGVLSFGSGAVLSGADIILTSDGALPGRGSNGNLTIVASGTMTLSANLNLGRGTLDLSAGSNTIEGSNTVLSVGTLRLRQAAGFGASNPFMNIRLNTGGVEFISASSASQTLHEWMVSLVSDRRTSRRRHLTVRTGGDLVVDRDVVLGGRDLVLVAGDGSTTGALNFMAATGETRRLEGNNVNLLSDKGAATPAAGINNFDITIRALSGDLTIGARVNAGAGDLTLSASARRRTGRIMWSSDQASSLSGAAISLTSSRDLLDQPSGQDLTVTGTGAVSIATSIDVGAGNLMVSTTGGAISFGRSRTTSLRGTNIALTSNVTTIAEASAEAGSGRSLTITALGTLQVSAALNLVRRVSRRSVLRGNLVLTAGIGEVLSSSAPGSSLSAGRISLAQASVFVTSNRFGVVTLPSGGTLELVSTSSSALVVQPWMVSAVSAQHLIIRAVGDVNVGVSIELASARNLTLEAGMGDGSGAINFTGSSALTLIGNDVSLTAGLAVDGGVKAPAPFGQDLTITAGGNLLVHADIDAGAGALSLTAGTATRSARSGQIRFSPDRLVTLTGSALELTADRRPSVEGRGVGLRRATVWEEAVASDPFNVATNVGQLEFITTATAAQAVQAWMVSRANSSGSALAVRGAGDVVVANDLIYGRGLILEAGYNGGTGAITFGTVDADMVRALEGSEVTLLSTRASSPSGFALRIRARGDLTVGADLTGDGALTLEAGFGTRRVRVRGRTRSVANDGALTLTGARTLSGSSVTLTGDLAPEQSAGVVSITALTGDVNVNSDINAGSNNISLTASAGAINFNSSRLTVLTGGALSLTATSSPAASSGQTLRLVSSSVWAAASATNPFKTTTTTSVGQIEFVTTSTSDQTVHDWMVTLATSSGDAGLGVRARGNVVVGSSLALGAGDLTLEAGRGTMAMMMTNEMGEQVEVQVRNPGLINFTGPAPLVLSGGDIILDAHGAVSSPFGQNLTITAQGDLEVNADISTSGVLGLTAGASTVAGETGELRFDGQGSRAVVLRANSFMVAGDGVSNVMSGLGLRLISMLPFEAANFTNFEPNVAELEFNALSSSSQPVGAWMVVSGARLVVRASGDLSVSGNLVLVSTDLRGLRSNGRSLILEAGYDVPDSGTSNSGTINFIETVELDAETIMLFGDGPTATGLAGDVVVRTSFDLTIGAHLNSGTGNLRLEAGFGTRRARVGRRTRTLANNGDVVLTGTRTLGGAGINLLGNAVMAEALTVEASGDLTIGTNIEATGDLVLTADRVRFSGSRTLRGENISLRSTGDLETHRRRENVTVRARGNLTLNGPLTSGRGNLTLEAGASETVETMMDGMAVTNVEENFGVITVGTALATELRGVSVVLTADEFGSDGTTRLEPSVGTLAVSIIATGNLTVGTSLLTAGDLTLTASGSRSELRFSSTRSIDLSGAEVSMTSRRAPRRGSDQAVRVVSSGDLMVRALLNVGSGSVSFTAAGALDFPTRTRRGVTTPTLSITAGELSFSQGEVFDGTVPVIFRGGLTGLAVNYSGAGMQEVEGWMVRLGIDVEIVSSGVLVIGRNIDTGTGNLTLSAAGGLSFTGASGERFVRGNDIIVTSDSDSSGSEVVMSTVNLRIEGRGDVTINDAITVSGASSVLWITAGIDVTRTVRGRSVTELGSGGISATGSPALTAGSIFLDQTEDFAVEDSFVLSSTAAVSITTRRSSLLTVRDWMIALNRDLSLSTEVFGDIIFASGSSGGTASYNFGTGSLTLGASGATRFTFTDGGVVNGSVMVDAMMIDVNGNIEAGVHNLELDASGALDFSADVVRLSARMLTLEAGSSSASSATNLFIAVTGGLSLSTSLTASGILGIDTGGAVPVFNGGATLSATSFDIDFHCMTQCSITPAPSN